MVRKSISFLGICPALLGLAAGVAYSAGLKRVDFGVNGHPLVSGSYIDIPLKQQIMLLKSIGLKTYRVNINPTHKNKFQRMSQLISLARGESIRILPNVILPPKEYSDEGAAFDEANAATYQLVKETGDGISVWELGNEYDLYCLKKGTNGSVPADYNPARYAIVRGLLRGMLAGLREANPSAESIIETSQHNPASVDIGFLEKLLHDGVRFDITGYHYYSRSGRVPTDSSGTDSLQVLHDLFHKPIWITEFDEAALSPELGPSSDPEVQGRALRTAMTEIIADADRFDVVGADIYELLNEPQLSGPSGVKPNQAQFGILSASGDATAASRAVKHFLSGN